jgi:hypothetical protein
MAQPVATLTPFHENALERLLSRFTRLLAAARALPGDVHNIAHRNEALGSRNDFLPIIGTSSAADRYRKVIDFIRAQPDDYDDGFNEAFAAFVNKLDLQPDRLTLKLTMREGPALTSIKYRRKEMPVPQGSETFRGEHLAHCGGSTQRCSLLLERLTDLIDRIIACAGLWSWARLFLGCSRGPGRVAAKNSGRSRWQKV